MKTNKTTLIYLTLLVSLIGAFLASPSASATLQASVPIIEPKTLDLDNPDTVIVHVKLNDTSGNSIVNQINASTVLLENAIPPTNTYISKQSEFIAEFDGYTVAAHISARISHMGITAPKPWVPINIPLKITGLLKNEYGSTPWEGTGKIKVYIVGSSPPPPP